MVTIEDGQERVTIEDGQERVAMEEENEGNTRGEFSENDSGEDEGDWLVTEEQLEKTKFQIISGNKKGSQWLVLDNAYILHKNDESSDEYSGDTTFEL